MLEKYTTFRVVRSFLKMFCGIDVSQVQGMIDDVHYFCVAKWFEGH